MIYRLLRLFWRLALHVFFRETEVEGIDRVPRAGPLLLVSNHANAFVDAILVVALLDRRVTLTAKGTLRRNPLLRFLIDGLGIVEFQRRQDVGEGADPSRNDEAMAECGQRLRDGAAICIFPEGVSHSDPSLRPFRKGAARIALDFVSAEGEDRAIPLRVVPVGLQYEAKEKLRSAVWIRFDEPIDVAAWASANQGDAEALTDLVETRVRELTQNFGRRREALLIDWAEEVWSSVVGMPAPLDAKERTYSARVLLIERLQRAWESLASAGDSEVAALVGRLRKFRVALRGLGISARELFLSMNPLRAAFFVLRELEIIVIGAPIAALGLAQHLLPALAIRAIAKLLSKDRDHWASNVIVPGIVVWPVALWLEAMAVALVSSGAWAVGWLVVAPFTLVYVTLYAERVGNALRRARAFVLLAASRGRRNTLRDEATALVAEMTRILARSESERTTQ